jgi:hypothetical protein
LAATIELLSKDAPRLALLTAEYRLLSLEHRRAYLDDAMRVPLDERAHVLVADDSAASRALAKHLRRRQRLRVQHPKDARGAC